MAESKQNRKNSPDVLIADACHPEPALKQVRIHPHTPNAFLGLSTLFKVCVMLGLDTETGVCQECWRVLRYKGGYDHRGVVLRGL